MLNFLQSNAKIADKANRIMYEFTSKYFLVIVMACSLLSCALMSPPEKKLPGSRFAISCSSTDAFGPGKCDKDAKDFCENTPVAERTMSEPFGKETTYTTWYYCP